MPTISVDAWMTQKSGAGPVWCGAGTCAMAVERAKRLAPHTVCAMRDMYTATDEEWGSDARAARAWVTTFTLI